MKKIFTLMFGALLLWSACTEKDKEPLLNPGAAPTITSPSGGTAFVLDSATQQEVFSTFSWTEADFGYQAGVSYTLELDKAGNSFAAPITVGTINGLKLEGVTKGKINAILLAKDLPGEEVADVEFRVVAKIGSDATLPVLASPVVTLKITPYSENIVYPQLQVPGDYQGWKPEENKTIIFSARSDEKYEGYVNFPNATTQFKYTKGPSWTTNWGDDGANGSLDPNGANIAASGAGVYKLNVNLNDLTHTYVKTDWGLIGSATPGGWDSDQNMSYDPATNKWSITLDLVAGDIKFRANDGWDINLGDTGANKKMEYGGDNIAIAEAGNYTIELNLGVAIYTYKVTKN